jgi:hypothetical protein
LVAAEAPTVTPGSLKSGDTPNFTETYDTKDVGTGKTLTPAGSVSDGNSGANYDVTFVPEAVGAITPATLTVSGITANDKVYDATTDPTLNTGSGALVGVLGSDDVSLDPTEATGAFSDANVGTGKTVTVSDLTLTGSDATDYTLTQPTATASITQRPIMVTAATNSKTYDGTTAAAAVPTITSGTLQGSDISNFTETYDNRNVGTGKTLIPAGTVNDGNGGANYDVTFVNNTDGFIDLRPMTVTATTNAKVYDSSTSAAAVPTITPGSLGTGDTAAFTETYVSKNVGTGKTLIPIGSVSDGNGGANYDVTFIDDTTGIITPSVLTVTGLSASDKTYDGATGATVTGTPTLNGVLGSDLIEVTGTVVGTFSDKNVGTNKSVAVSGLSLSGLVSSNYTLTEPTLSADIIALPITVTAAANTKTYDGTTAAAAVPTITSGALQGSDTANFTETYDTKKVGSGKTVTPSGVVNDGNGGKNYTVAFQTSANGEIDAAPITVTAAANSKTYDGATTASASPTITGTIFAGDTPAFAETYDTKDVGTGKTLTPAGSVSDGNSGANYDVTFVPASDGAITPATLTVSGITANDKVYDATTDATLNTGGGSLVGVFGGDTVSLDATGATGAFGDANVGSGKTVTVSGLALTGADADDYTLTQPTTTANITQAPLTITAQTNTKTYDGDATAVAAPIVTGLQGSDTVTGLAEDYDNKNVGTGKTLSVSAYTVNDSNSGANYDVSTVNDTTGVITTRPITVTASANAKVYDATTAAAAIPTVTSGSLAPGDTGNFTETYNTKEVGTDKTINPAGSVNDGNSGNNYSITFQSSTNGIVTSAPLTVSGVSAGNKIYDGTTAASLSGTGSLVGVAAGDTVILSGTPTATFSDKNVGAGKSVSISGYLLTGDDAANYSLAEPTLTTYITVAPLTITAQTNTKIYDGTTAAATTPIAAGLQGSDTVSGLAETYDTANVGAGKTLAVSAYTVNDGNAGNNYAVTTVADHTGVINKRTATVTFSDMLQTYDGAAVSATVTTGPSGLSTSVTYDGSPTAPTNAGSYAVVATITNPNYTGSADGTLVIGKADQTISFGTLPDAIFGAPDFSVSATASSGLTVTFNSSGTCTVSGTTVHITGVGKCAITASQAGNGNYNVAPDKRQSFIVNPVTYTLTYTAGANGSITGSSQQTVDEGASGSAVTAVPATGYQFSSWSDASTTTRRRCASGSSPHRRRGRA